MAVLVAIPHLHTFVNHFQNWLGELNLCPICDEKFCNENICNKLLSSVKTLDAILHAAKENVKKSWSDLADLKNQRTFDLGNVRFPIKQPLKPCCL